MSNTQVGNVYSQIIADVIESSRVDFEEGGVDEHVLDELRRVCPLPFLSIHPPLHHIFHLFTLSPSSMHSVIFSKLFLRFLDGNG